MIYKPFIKYLLHAGHLTPVVYTSIALSYGFNYTYYANKEVEALRGQVIYLDSQLVNQRIRISYVSATPKPGLFPKI